MFENIGTFFKKIMKNDTKELVSDTTAVNTSKDAAKERLQLVLMQDRANVSADFLELMKQEIIDVIKKYIVVEEDTIDVRIINQENEDGTNGAPSLCANIPILNIRNDNKSERLKEHEDVKMPENGEEVKVEDEKLEEVTDVENNIIAEENNVEEIVKEEIIEPTESKENIIEEVVEEVKEEINEISEDILEALSDEDNEEPELDDEDDDDVTFDDLLKAAEEEEKMQEQTKEAPKPKSANRRNTSKNKNKRKKVNKK